MSDPVRPAPPSVALPPETPSTQTPSPQTLSPGTLPRPDLYPEALPDLGDLIAAGEWRRALAVSRVAGRHPDLQVAIQNVNDVQEAVRARRYAAARRSLEGYRAALSHLRADEMGTATSMEPGMAALLQTHADPNTLWAGVDALERLRQEPDPATLEAGLAPALLHPLTSAEALNLRGVQAVLQGEPERGRALFTEALEVDAGHYRALSNLGNIELEAGNYPAAEARYREVIALNPEYDGGHHNLGVVLRKQGRVWDGVQAIKRGQQLNVKQSKADAKAEAQEQLRRDPRLRAMRWVLLGGAALVAALALFGGQL